MKFPKYEHHSYSEKLPVIFHFDTLQRNNNPTRYFPNWHGAIEILYFKRGSACISLNGEKVIAETEDIIIINSNVVHTIFPQGEKCQYYCLIIDKKFIEKTGFPISQKNIRTKICDKELVNLYNYFIKSMHKRIPFYEQRATGYVYLILSHIYSLYSFDKETITQSGTKDKIEITKEAIIYIQSNFQSDITLEDISAHCHISKFYFCRTFREVTGINAIKFINSVRCERARELLTSGEHSVSEISGLCGFESPSYFTKTFKSFYGITPTSLKNNRQETL